MGRRTYGSNVENNIVIDEVVAEADSLRTDDDNNEVSKKLDIKLIILVIVLSMCCVIGCIVLVLKVFDVSKGASMPEDAAKGYIQAIADGDEVAFKRYLPPIVRDEGYVADTEMAVSGVVTKFKYQENFDSYNIWLEVPEGASYEFQIYSGKLGENLLTPEVGDTVVASGKSKIYTPKDETQPVVYELAYASSHKVSPQIVDVIRLSDYYMRGSFDESWNALSTHQFRMTGEATQELTVAVAAGTEFKVAVADWSKEANASHLVLDASVAEGTFSGEATSNVKLLEHIDSFLIYQAKLQY